MASHMQNDGDIGGEMKKSCHWCKKLKDGLGSYWGGAPSAFTTLYQYGFPFWMCNDCYKEIWLSKEPPHEEK